MKALDHAQWFRDAAAEHRRLSKVEWEAHAALHNGRGSISSTNGDS